MGVGGTRNSKGGKVPVMDAAIATTALVQIPAPSASLITAKGEQPGVTPRSVRCTLLLTSLPPKSHKCDLNHNDTVLKTTKWL